MKNIKRNTTSVAIYKALSTLLETHNFESISVNDICSQALISRTTFYSYFEDKYQLVLFFFNEQREHLGIISGADIENNIIMLFTHIRDNEGMYRNLWTSGVNSDLDRMITEQVGTNVRAFLEMKESNYNLDEIEIIVQLYTGGVAYVISQWLNGGAQLDIELLAKTITDRLSLINE